MKKLVLLFVFIYYILLSAGAQTSTAPSGSGTSADPYQVATLDNLYWLSQNSGAWSSYFIQTADIDATSTKSWDSGKGFSPIGNNSVMFQGNYYGKGHYIKGLYIRRTASSYIGLFGYISNSIIDSLGIINTDIDGSRYVGALAGYTTNSSTIEYCYTTGNIHGGNNYAGGLVGYNNSTISYCFSGCNISGMMNLGGLVGFTGNTISYCYATGNITATYGYAGGFAGSSIGYYANINSCYSIGSVTDVNNYNSNIDGFVGYLYMGVTTGCYINTQTSGRVSSFATALTTAQMKKPANLTGLGSFSTIWKIREDSTYAALRRISNNAPFTMPDTLIMFGRTHFSSIFRNDFDYETLQNNQVFKFTDLSFRKMEEHLTDYKTYFCLGTFVLEGDSRTLGYCVGEVLAPGDTLWGNSAKVVMKQGANRFPKIKRDSLFIKEDSILNVPASILMANDSDPDGDIITYEGAYTCGIKHGKLKSLNRHDSLIYVPNPNWNGIEKVPYCISDGRLYICTYVVVTVIPVNDAPVLLSVATGKTTNEDTPVTIKMSDVTATDIEDDKLHIILEAGANYTFTDSTLTPALNYNGSLAVQVAVADNEDTSNVMTMNLTVRSVYDPPMITSVAPTTATVGVKYTYTVIASDPDNSTLTYSLSGQPSGMIINNNIITWTPANGTTSSGTVTLTVSDGTQTVTQQFTISVSGTNYAPVITSTATTKAVAGTQYTYIVTATDANGDALTYTLSNAPSGMTINTSHVITWTPAVGTTTSGTVTLTVSDGKLAASEAFTITVNNAPVITSTAPTTANEGQAYTYTATATDANGDALTYTLGTAPSGMTINNTSHVISWTPIAGTTTSGDVTLSVSDGKLTTYQIFTIDVNNAPAITSTAPTFVNEGQTYTYTATATDANGDALTYTLSNTPSGMTINASHVISWTPAVGTTTSGAVTLTVSDRKLTATQVFTIAVNNAPVITSTAPTTANEGQAYTYTATATDTNGDALTYTLSNTPSGMTINASHVISWTPAVGTTTSGAVTLTVSDGKLTATQVFTIAVNNAPVITSTTPTTANEGQAYTYTATATDANGDALTYTLSNTPSGMTINASHVISWTPAVGTTTSSAVTLTVSDGKLTATQVFTIAVNNAPAITSSAPTSVNVGQAYSYTATATDANGDALTYGLSNAPSGMTINASHVISWTPAVGTTTSGAVTLTVSDGKLTATQVFTIAVNNAPVITSTASITANEGQAYSYSVTATDANGDLLTYTLNNAPSGMSITAGGLITWTPVSGITSSGLIKLTVSDGILIAEQEFTITVSENTTKYNQSITFNEIPSKIYGNAPFTVSATGGESGNPVTFTSSDSTTATCSGINGSTITILKAGSCNIYANQAGNSSYNDALQVGQVLTINPKKVTVNGITPDGKIYDGNTSLSIAGGTLDGVLTGDEVNLLIGTATFSDKNTGTGKPLIAAGFALSGAAAGNYVLTQPTDLTANITPANLTIGLTAQDKTYDGNTDAVVTASIINGLIHGDDVTVKADKGKFDNGDAGNNKTVTSIITISGTDAGNYLCDSTASTKANILENKSPVVIFPDLSKGVLANTKISLEIAFSEPVNMISSTLEDALILHEGGSNGSALLFKPTGFSENNILHFTITAGFKCGASYYLAIKAGSFVDSSGNAVALTEKTFSTDSALDKPLITAISNKTTLCPGDYLTISNYNNNLSYKWQLAGNSITDQTGSSQYQLPVYENGNYSVQAFNSKSGCESVSESYPVQLHALIMPIVYEKDDKDLVSLLFVDNSAMTFTDYHWMNADGSSLPAGIINNRQFLILTGSDLNGQYKVQVTDKNGCQAFSDTSSAKAGVAYVKVYPTVNNGNFKIDIMHPDNGRVIVNIINLAGESLRQYRFNKSYKEETFNINMNKSIGQYMIEVTINGYRKTQKIIVVE